MGWDHEQFKRDLAALDTAPCPGCGQIHGRQESHPMTGTMVNCGCGVRSTMRAWLAGKVEYRRNPNGTYRWAGA